MFANAIHVLVAFTVAAVGVSAQSSSGLPSGIDSCVLGCLSSAQGPNTCASFTDVTCVCSNSAFQSAATQCLQSKCTSQDQQAALTLQQQQCAAVSSSATSALSSASSSASSAASSLSSGASSKSSSLSSAASSAASSLSSQASAASSAASSASSAANGAVPIFQIPLIPAAVALAGVALGGALVL
ncbi:hypothetical protein BC834DRAFT_970929 [Gloeopeniophorella convolvens]|nr:hypothetical protein BC834DRAFT_970929 [Gloeopeniophorella convolvens]